MEERCTFVIAVNDKDVLKKTFLCSPALKYFEEKEIFIQEGYSSASRAYNAGIAKAKNELLIFAHQDIFLPENWFQDLEINLNYLEKHDKNWGVLGCFGVTKDGINYGNVYSTGLGRFVGAPFGAPQKIQTLDEIILIFRKSSGLRFDEGLPHFHFYGTDICLEAQSMGKTNYAIDAFCIHNSNQVIRYSREFYECYRYIRRKHKNMLPIHTSCVRVTAGNLEYWIDKWRMARLPFSRSKKGNLREENVLGLWEKMRLERKADV